MKIITSAVMVALLGTAFNLHSQTNTALASQIEQLLLRKIPVPKLRPDRLQTNSIVPTQAGTLPALIANEPVIVPKNGTLQQGLNALKIKDASTALAIRAGMKPGSLDRKILAWAIALSNLQGISSATITKIARDLSNWPGQTVMQRNVERALARETFSSAKVIAAFQNAGLPQSVEGGMLLADAHLQHGSRNKAKAVIAPFWRNQVLDKKAEDKILARFDALLTRNDHRQRMHMLFYKDRSKAAMRVAAKAEQFSLAKARTASLTNSSKAPALIKAVAASSKKDTGFLFSRIEQARRAGNYETAAKLLRTAPRDADKLVDPDEWWVERRIVSRQMLEIGKVKLAYKLVSKYTPGSPSTNADAEFHAGWYALRFLKDRATAQTHFKRLAANSKRPISLARGHYWLGRASSGEAAKTHYRNAAQHKGTFYGQLALLELNGNALAINRPKPSAQDRNTYKTRELVQAIKRLEAINQERRTASLYHHLARTLKSPGELAILAADAEKRGDYSLSLQVGKLAYGRGLSVDTLSWPLGAIPQSAKINGAGRALAYSIARQESAFNKAAISPANARGLLQLLPGTAKAVARKQGLKYSKALLTRDAGYNATLGAAYLEEQLQKFENSYILTFAAYNAGPARVEEWLERFGDPRGMKLYQVIDWIERIPFTETRSYVQRIMENYQVYQARISNASLNLRGNLLRGRR